MILGAGLDKVGVPESKKTGPYCYGLAQPDIKEVLNARRKKSHSRGLCALIFRDANLVPTMWPTAIYCTDSRIMANQYYDFGIMQTRFYLTGLGFMRTNELAFLKANFTKPVSWRLTRTSDSEKGKAAYTLDFTYLQPQDWGDFKVGDKWLGHWVPLHTRRGDVKLYKSADAALSDVRAVQGDDTEAVIYFRGG